MDNVNLETRRAYADRSDIELQKVMGHGSAFIDTTTLVGKDVCNLKGESLGELKEIVIDARDGRVAYVVLSSGGFLSIGSRLFAVPWSALRLDTVSNGPILDVDKAFMEGAPGFDEEQWPDMADPAWVSQIHSYYGTRLLDDRPALTA